MAYREEKGSKMRFKDLTGQKFGRLTAIKHAGNDKHNHAMWLCKCDCGNEIIVVGYSLRNGVTKSCGCFQRENAIKVGKLNKIHGHCQNNKSSKTYESWHSMIQRCNNSRHKAYNNYGGRGIKICKRWLKFENFLEDMGECPLSLTLDKIDNNGNYRKENCHWTTMKNQERNRGNNHSITYDGRTQCLSAWAEEYHICPVLLRYRLNHGYSTEEALTIPVRRYKINVYKSIRM